MTDDDTATLLHRWLAERGLGVGPGNPPLYLTAVLGCIAAILVARTTLGALENGYPAIGLSMIASVLTFVATLVSLETGRQLGTRTD